MATPSQRPAEDPAANAALLLMRVGLLVLAFAVPISTVVSRRAVFTLLPVGVALLLVATTLLPRPPVGVRLARGLSSTVGLAGIALLAWSAASILWTPFPGDALERLLKECGTVLVVVTTIVMLPDRTRTSNLYLLPLGLAAAALTTAAAAVAGPQAIGAFQDADSTLERAVLTLVTLVWPAIGALAVRDRWVSAALLTLAVTLASMAAWTSVALVALALGGLVFALATLGPRAVGATLGIGAAALVLFAPMLPLMLDPLAAGLADAVGDRLPALLDIAQSVHVWAALTVAQPVRLVTGHGLDMATRAIQAGFLPPETPRSLLFEIWYELGLVGGVSSAALVAGGFAAAGRTSPTVAPFLLAAAMTAFAVSVWGLDTTQLWWITLLSVVAIAFAIVIRGQYRTDRPAVRLEPPMAASPAR